MIQRAAITVIVLALGARSFDASAQTSNEQRFHQFMSTDFHKGLVYRAIAGLPRTVFQRCPSLVSSNSVVTILRPIGFGEHEFPNNGAWKEAFPVSGCGNDTTLNFYFFVGADEKVNTVIGEPGTTHADPLLQNDAVKYVNIAAAAFAKNCTSFDVKNTQFESYGDPKSSIPDPGPHSSSLPWWETWTMVGCGRVFDVPVGFVPEGKGTRIYVVAAVKAH